MLQIYTHDYPSVTLYVLRVDGILNTSVDKEISI